MKNHEFEKAVAEYKEKGTLVFKDAEADLSLHITEADVAAATVKDEAHCVVAKSIGRTQLGVSHVSVGGTITKILLRGGELLRYETSKRLQKALEHFDATGDWNLEPGFYVLRAPKGANVLTENMSKEQRKDKVKRWKKFEQKFSNGESDGSGITHHQGRPLDAREITIVRKRKSKKAE